MNAPTPLHDDSIREMAAKLRAEVPAISRRLRYLWLGLATALGACATSAAVEFDDELFDRHDVDLGSAKHQTILQGRFLDGATADLAVINVDEEDARMLRVYAFNGAAWELARETPLRDDVVFVDVVNVDGRDRLVTYEPGRMNWIDLDTSASGVLVEIPFEFDAGADGGIPHVDIAKDINGDGRDDFVAPGPEGFWISTQLDSGSFADAVKLGPAEPFLDHVVVDEARSYRDVGVTPMTLSWYLSRVHTVDRDLDGRTDLAFWNQDRLEVHLQDDQGRFDLEPRAWRLDAPIASDGAYSRLFDYSDSGALSIIFGSGEQTERTVLESLRDVNGDGIADLTTLTYSGRSLAKQRSVYEVRSGAATPDGVAFDAAVGATIRPQGTTGGMEAWGYAFRRWEDFDGDGQVDVLFGDVAVGLGGMSRAMLAGSIAMNLEAHRVLAGDAASRIKVRPSGRPAGGGVFFPAVLLGDVNGDGRHDLLVGRRHDQMNLRYGTAGPGLFADESRVVAVDLPDDERNIWLADMNGDGKQDILVHHVSSDRPNGASVLFAR